MKTKLFNYATSIDNKKFKYPVTPGMSVLFFTPDAFYIYALFTKQDYTEPQLIQVSRQTYQEIKEILSVETDAPELFSADEDTINFIINVIKYKAIIDDISVGQYLDFATNNDELSN